MDDLSEFDEKIRKYIVRQIKESPDEYFSFDGISFDLGIDENIVQETLKSFYKEKRIKIKYLKNHIKPRQKFFNLLLSILTGIVPDYWYRNSNWFKIVVLDEFWFNRQ